MTSCSIGKHLTRTAMAFTGKHVAAGTFYNIRWCSVNFFRSPGGVLF
jgi:hypothetical protein